MTTPKLRLAAELGWLPGLPPSEAAGVIASPWTTVLDTADQDLPTLVKVNVMAGAFLPAPEDPADDFAHLAPNRAAGLILRFAHLLAAIVPDQVLRDINADRGVSGFPEIESTARIETELAVLRRRYRGVVRNALDRMPPAALVGVMAQAVRIDTGHGERPGTRFLEELVDLYQDETQDFLRGEMGKIESLQDCIRSVIPQGVGQVSRVIRTLEEVVRNWVKVAEPIQLSLRARGMAHAMSQHTAYGIRLSIGIDLFNQHGLLAQARHITRLLQELFAYVPDVAACVGEDSSTIESIGEKREQAARKRAEQAETINYRTEIGFLFKTQLAISAKGVEWRGRKAGPGVRRVLPRRHRTATLWPMRLCLIPARGGSKRIPRKNVKPFHGRPMIHYPIAAARASGLYDRIVVSTDDDEIARVAVEGGAEVPFRRPAALADDHATTAAVILHGLEALGGPAALASVTCLYATAPFVRAADLAGAEALRRQRQAPVVFSVTTFAYPILRALTRDPEGRVAMIWPEHRLARSNDLVEAWHDAGQFYVLDPAAFVARPDLFGTGALGYPLPRHRVQDLDTSEDWRRAELMYDVLEREDRG